MNTIHPVMQAALAPWAPPPAVDRLNDDDAYVVDIVNNRVIRRCSTGLARSGIPVTTGHAVMTGEQARRHLEVAMCAELEAWCTANALPYLSANDLLAEHDAALTPEQREYLSTYVQRWDALFPSVELTT